MARVNPMQFVVGVGDKRPSLQPDNVMVFALVADLRPSPVVPEDAEQVDPRPPHSVPATGADTVTPQEFHFPDLGVAAKGVPPAGEF
jgi:hypothetical protein